MKARIIFSMFLATVLVMGITSCSTSPGFAPKTAMIKGVVTYEGGNAAGAIISIAFDASEATSEFDYSTVANGNGEYSFEGLAKGKYYVDAEFTDNNGFTFTTGGYLIEIGGKKSEVSQDITLE